MASLDLLVQALDHALWEMGEGFKGLPDADVWKRPHPRLLSVGELAAHVAYGEAQAILGGFESPLIVKNAEYYPHTLAVPLDLPLGADAVYAEVQRVHDACKAALVAEPHDSEDRNPQREGWTWGYVLEYMAFHVAYHTGQIYSVRHLLGHETVDN